MPPFSQERERSKMKQLTLFEMPLTFKEMIRVEDKLWANAISYTFPLKMKLEALGYNTDEIDDIFNTDDERK